MDYADEECRDRFTPGQIARMHAMLEYQRSQLFSDDVYCFGDLDGDCHVGTSDLMIVLSNYGCEFCSEGDIDLNHTVNSEDILALLYMYGVNCGCDDPFFIKSPANKPENVHELLRRLLEHDGNTGQ